jgi:hypothetical protein
MCMYSTHVQLCLEVRRAYLDAVDVAKEACQDSADVPLAVGLVAYDCATMVNRTGDAGGLHDEDIRPRCAHVRHRERRCKCW